MSVPPNSQDEPDLGSVSRLLEHHASQSTFCDYQKFNHSALENCNDEKNFRFAHVSLPRRSQKPIDDALKIISKPSQ